MLHNLNKYVWCYIRLKAFWSGLFSSSLPIVIACNAWWEGIEMLEIFDYLIVVHFTGQDWVSKPVCCIRRVMVCKIGFTNWNAKLLLLRASMVYAYYIKLFWTGADRHNGILMSLLLLVAETMKEKSTYILKLHIGIYLKETLLPRVDKTFQNMS